MTEEHKRILNKHIDQLVSETENYADAAQYIDDIFYDFENDIRLKISKEDVEKYVEYIQAQLKLKAKP